MNRIDSRNSWVVPSPRQELASVCDALRMMSNKLSAIPKPSRSLSLGCTALVSTQVVCAVARSRLLCIELLQSSREAKTSRILQQSCCG